MATPQPPALPRHGAGGASLTGHRVRLVALALVTIVSAGVLCGAGYLWYNARGINSAYQGRNVAVGSAQGTSDIDGKAQNILLVGNDDRTNMTTAEAAELHVGKDGGSMATDTMMIVHVPANGAKATLISLPRDSYVAIPGLSGDGKDKLNSAYVYGYNRVATAPIAQRQTNGINLLLKTVENLTGLTIDHYVQVSLLGFVRISNAIGGVPINLCGDVNDTHAYNVAHGETGGSGFKMTKGRHTIRGITALEFVRQRHNFPDGREDLDRVKRQQYFLTSAFRQVSGVGVVTKLSAIKNALTDSLIADSKLHLFDLARQMSGLSADNIVGRTIPTTVGTSNTGQDVLIVDPAKVQAFVDKLINPAKTGAASSTGTKPSRSASASTSASPTTTPIDAKCIN